MGRVSIGGAVQVDPGYPVLFVVDPALAFSSCFQHLLSALTCPAFALMSNEEMEPSAELCRRVQPTPLHIGTSRGIPGVTGRLVDSIDVAGQGLTLVHMCSSA